MRTARGALQRQKPPRDNDQHIGMITHLHEEVERLSVRLKAHG